MSGETKRLTGRALDAAVAERCFNFRGKITVEVYGGTTSYRQTGPNYSLIPNYSTDMADAWQVAEWIREQTGVFMLEWWEETRTWACMYAFDDNEFEELNGGARVATADTPSEAICHAALELKERLEREAA